MSDFIKAREFVSAWLWDCREHGSVRRTTDREWDNHRCADVADMLKDYTKELQAKVEKLTAAPIKIAVKTKDVWITFDAGEGRQSMLCLNNIVNDMHNEGITKGICRDAIKAALKLEDEIRYRDGMKALENQAKEDLRSK